MACRLCRGACGAMLWWILFIAVWWSYCRRVCFVQKYGSFLGNVLCVHVCVCMGGWACVHGWVGMCVCVGAWACVHGCMGMCALLR